jgi:hypothetical protein
MVSIRDEGDFIRGRFPAAICTDYPHARPAHAETNDTASMKKAALRRSYASSTNF